MDAYCVQCKSTNGVKDVKETISKNKRKMAKGLCSDCGTKMNKFLKG